MHEFATSRRIEFADTDMGGIVHFSRFLIFMETAEHQFLEALGTSVATELEGRRIGWPRVAVSCEYQSPARFGDRLEIRLRVVRKGSRSMTYAFEFRCDGREVARGRSTSVCCVHEPDGGLRSIPVPASVADQIQEAPR